MKTKLKNGYAVYFGSDEVGWNRLRDGDEIFATEEEAENFSIDVFLQWREAGENPGELEFGHAGNCKIVEINGDCEANV